MGTTVTPNLGLIKPDSTEPAQNWPTQVGANYDKIDDLIGADLPTNVPFYDEGTFTPTLIASSTNPTLGSSPTLHGYYTRIGLLIQFWWYIQFGSGMSPGNGSYQASYPFVINTTRFPNSTHVLGSGYVTDLNSSAARRVATIRNHQDNKFIWLIDSESFVTHSTPFTWQDGDILWAEGKYIADSSLVAP